ncbi:L-serine ammonia-lyase, iron-sulfur-dependent, subunit alpha [Bifidobacterium sp. ESL0682]|uniref:L-serine ammonia-lyase, iron-sulfur-dependent, subunit alpha n=1 Tax=Bifidobacterium sp. ESL0682 TaxID=2983212 RepID=UPI0023F9A6DB|nr:L-serine ammonia-lyase, iron-sulfur-dependent, subunit alpha [Bifidobacterium sp. ESL0682]WEV41886.1 L-serine ammonia-lyase, iron-sulfur-dependent, subunit alpha [Bifidobacterium sp. ESL0682]
MYSKVAELVEDAERQGLPIHELMIRQEMAYSHESREEIWEKMGRNLDVMHQAVERGAAGEGVHSTTGLTGGDAVKLRKYREHGKTLSGDTMMMAVQNAMACNEVNAAMGVICATPTAGSSGTIPGILFTLTERLGLDRDQQIRFLFTAGAFGLIIANNAGIAGATGGCQAEVGSASAMGAAAAVEAAGGTPSQSAQAMAMAISNLLGLICDPVAGLVELPCVKRNAIGAGNGLIAADMALAGIVSKIPPDEVIGAMDAVGKSLPSKFRETGLGGLADTPTGRRLRASIFPNQKDPSAFRKTGA